MVVEAQAAASSVELTLLVHIDIVAVNSVGSSGNQPGGDCVTVGFVVDVDAVGVVGVSVGGWCWQ